MKRKLRRLETLSFYDHTGIESHLAKMAKKGWMIAGITNQCWTYRKIQPGEYQFSVTYYPKATDFDPAPSDDQQTFYDFCAHTGWKLACSWFQMQIFYHTSPNPIPIDTDPVYEVETIHKACRKNFLRGYLLLLLLGAVGTYFLYSALVGHTLHFITLTSADTSFWLSRLDVEQRHHFDDEPSADIPHLKYSVYSVNFHPLFDFFKCQLMRTTLLGHDKAKLTPINHDLFAADRAYQMIDENGDPITRYVLCYDHTLVRLESNWPLTAAQMTALGEKLRGI